MPTEGGGIINVIAATQLDSNRVESSRGRQASTAQPSLSTAKEAKRNIFPLTHSLAFSLSLSRVNVNAGEWNFFS